MDIFRILGKPGRYVLDTEPESSTGDLGALRAFVRKASVDPLTETELTRNVRQIIDLAGSRLRSVHVYDVESNGLRALFIGDRIDPGTVLKVAQRNLKG